MIYADCTGSFNCQWSDIPDGLRQVAARSMLENGEYPLIVNGWWCKLEKQERAFLEGILGIEAVALPQREPLPECIPKHPVILRLGTTPQMERFRELVKAGYTRAAWVAEEMRLKPYQVSRLAKRAIRSGWLVKQGMDYAMRFSTGRPRKL